MTATIHKIPSCLLPGWGGDRIPRLIRSGAFNRKLEPLRLFCHIQKQGTCSIQILSSDYGKSVF